MPTLETPNSGTGANLPPTASGEGAPACEMTRTHEVEESESEPESSEEVPDGAARAGSPMIAYLHQMFSKRLDAMQSMVEWLPGVAPPIRKSNPDFFADTPFTDEITLIEMPRKFSIPIIKAYDDTTDPDDHVTQYRQRILAVALPKGSSIASFSVLSDIFVEQFASSRDLKKTSDSLYVILHHRAEPVRGYIARFNQEKVAIPESSIPTGSYAFKRGLLTKWEEELASPAKAQQKPDPKTIRPDRTE
ncbi:hypothetical protein F2Q69_00006802 [Brassica cretica]|uniref:Retrotransposon gag domain-containing protein n=1 Tax=Brassica cretica TaxID=69181 RepID=A0A8S9PBH8_BRACR|nr:hypothetical protein F2Q69_00006802 [Brassica cretica]